MLIETLNPGEYAVALTENGYYRLQLHRDASNAAHVDVFNSNGIIQMGRVRSLLEAQMEFDQQNEDYASADRIKHVKSGK